MITAQNTKRISPQMLLSSRNCLRPHSTTCDKEDQLLSGTEWTEAVESVVGHHQEDEAGEGDSESTTVLRG